MKATLSFLASVDFGENFIFPNDPKGIASGAFWVHDFGGLKQKGSMTLTKRRKAKQDWSSIPGDQHVGSRIRYLRLQKLQISQQDFAAKIDVTRGAVSNWEQGTAAVGITNLKRIVHAFDVPMEWLVNGIGSPDPALRPTLTERMRLLPPGEYERLHNDLEALLDARLSYLNRDKATKASPRRKS